MTETIRERRGSPFYVSKHTFDAVPIPIWFTSESVAVAGENTCEIRCVINENRGFSQVTAVMKLAEKPPRRGFVRRWIQPERDDFVRLRTDSTVQPELLTVKADQLLIDRELIG